MVKEGLVRRFLNALSGTLRAKSTEYIEVELRELENIFALILLGSFIGLPSPPTSISLRLMPYMARELVIMSRVSERLDDMLGEMAGLFEIT
ncbi:MAG TPA: hypothetical protein ENF75_04880 [Acidilobales archaeon]|nr:MAG: hypothetical protein B6U85_07670 [Desulfurococcales archaeon ex4484_42]HDD26405.1 hypothetical protein [Acidilobales archaeon]